MQPNSNHPITLSDSQALYNTSLEENVQYIEARKNFEAYEWLYVIDESEEYRTTNGKRFLDNEGGEREAQAQNTPS